MNTELALELVDSLRKKYDDSPVYGGEVQNQIVNNRHQDPYDVLGGQWIPLQYDVLEGESLPELQLMNVLSEISKLHDGERWYILDRLKQSEKLITETISDISHNNFIDPLTKIDDPNQFYVPRSGEFLDYQNRQEIQSVADSFNADIKWLNTNNIDEHDQAIYAIHSGYIHFSQSTRLPLNNSDWLPPRSHGVNEEIGEHPLYCSYGNSPEVDAEYVLAIASIVSRNPTINDRSAVEIAVESS